MGNNADKGTQIMQDFLMNFHKTSHGHSKKMSFFVHYIWKKDQSGLYLWNISLLSNAYIYIDLKTQ